MSPSDELIPISTLFFDDPGPHVIRAGFPPENHGATKVTPARGQELRALLNKSIAQLGGVSGGTRRKTPAAIPAPVPIDTLLYRGRSALNRALELRGEIIDSGGPPAPAAIEELLDLVSLAATE